MPGTGSACDGLNELAFKVGKVDLEHSSAAWDAPARSGPPKPPLPESKTKGASKPARTRNARRRRLRRVDLVLMVLAASACVKLALAQERDRTEELEGHSLLAKASRH